MGQYWKLVNLDRHEYVDPHQLGHGAKLWEQLANTPGTGAAMVILCAAHRQNRGGGDLDFDRDWRDATFPELATDDPDKKEYLKVAQRTIGRWAGDRIALVGDYAEPSDLEGYTFIKSDGEIGTAEDIYHACYEGVFTNITEDVRKVIEHELGGKYVPNKFGLLEFIREQ